MANRALKQKYESANIRARKEAEADALAYNKIIPWAFRVPEAPEIQWSKLLRKVTNTKRIRLWIYNPKEQILGETNWLRGVRVKEILGRLDSHKIWITKYRIEDMANFLS